jgi:hypothetical protein
MKEFALLFRAPGFNTNDVSAEEMKEMEKKWMDWAGGIAAQGKVASNGQRLSHEGKVLKPGGVITDGPFVEIRERLGGFMIIRANDIDEATTLAHGCPALEYGGSVEIRPLYGN